MKTLCIFSYLIISLLLTGCYSQYQYQTARTIKPKEFEFGAGINLGNSSNFDYKYIFDTSDQSFGPFSLFEPQFFFRAGISSKVDIGIAVSPISKALSIDSKVMLIGDHTSKFVLSPGIGLRAGMYKERQKKPIDLELYIHTSYYFNDNIAVFLTPTYIIENDRFKYLNGNSLHRLGFSSGLEYRINTGKVIIGINRNWAINPSFKGEEFKVNFLSINLGWGITF